MSDNLRLNLKQRIFRAGGWTVIGFGFSQIIRFGSNLVMTRLLVPEMFGVMAIATIVMIGLAMFSDVGLRQNIVQSDRGNDAAFLNTAWIVQILRGILLWVIALVVSILIIYANYIGMIPKDSVYADMILPYVIMVVAISAVVSGFESTKIFEAIRNLSFKKITIIEIIAQIFGLLCMVGWAVADRSIWALVIGGIGASIVKMTLSHIWLDGVANRWQWDTAAFREIFHFGKWIFLSSIFGFLVNNGDRLLLGGLIDVTIFGIYVIAFFIFNSVEQVFGKFISDVSYPAFSEIVRKKPTELKTNYYQFYIVIASFVCLCSGILMISSEVLINLLYDPRYSQAGWMLQILAFALLAIPSRLVMQCFMAIGMPKLFSKITGVQLVILYLCVPSGFYFFGLPGALWGLVLSRFSALPIIIIYQIRLNLFDLRMQVTPLTTLFLGIAVGKLFNTF